VFFLPSKKHDDIAKRIAKKLNAEYNPSQGVDIVTKSKAIEVESSSETVSEAIMQLQGHNDKLKYIAVPDNEVAATIEKTKNTKVGVMDSKGNIKKSAGRPKKNK